ncbi:agmatine deiminase family protein [Nocardioides speluncae]|uniref:agmatine deiminase family protein n=1 Tax=Nocardioides speluncae TaxID=2670337 RepID=UPI00137A4FC7|nr:agmatine deiminase family protein [Nocardioides speluncae]
MPPEWAPHEVTWMAYGATVGVWGEDTVSPYGRDLTNARILARQDLVRLAANLSRFEPVAMLVDTEDDKAEAREFLAEIVDELSVKDQIGAELDGSGRLYIGEVDPAELPPVETHPLDFLVSPLNDLWVRDTGPVFVTDADGALHGLNLNFNGWGQAPITTGLKGWRKDREKAANGIVDQPIERDREVVYAIAEDSDVPLVETWLTIEGGGIEVNGSGLAVATESCILNPNRNPGKTKAEVEAELRRLFGVERMIWMPGRTGIELTDWHVDFLARFTSSGHLLYASAEGGEPQDKRDRRLLLEGVAAVNELPSDERERLLDGVAELTTDVVPAPDLLAVYDAFDRRNPDLPVTERSPAEFSETVAAGYIGYYEANGCIVMPQYGDTEADLEAFDIISELYPESLVIAITTDGLAAGGGTIHCATQQQPRVG